MTKTHGVEISIAGGGEEMVRNPLLGSFSVFVCFWFISCIDC